MAHTNFLFTSESVSEGHPDKVCDQISDAVLDAFLENDIELGIADDSAVNTRLGCETLTTTNKIVIAGEGRGQSPFFHKHGDKAVVNRELIAQIARDVVKDIGYDQDGFSFYGADVEVLLHGQSPDIAMGVDAKKKKSGEEEGAGDQGMMFGFACTESEVYEKNSFMPAPIYFAHKILKVLADKRRGGQLADLQPDAKSQVTVKYVNGQPVGCTKVVVSTQHKAQSRNNKKYTPGLIKEMISDAVESALPKGWMPKRPSDFLVNPTGNFVIGGPDGDCGLTGRKIIVDTYGGYAPHGGGAFSGKDPTKVDRSAAYAARYLAKNVVAAGVAERCTIQIAYAIGVADPMSVLVDTHGTGKVPESKLEKILPELFPLAADQHPPRTQAQPADLPAHRRLRPFRPRAGQRRRFLLGAHRPRRCDPAGGEVRRNSAVEFRLSCPAKAGIQYSRLCLIERLVFTGSPACAGDDTMNRAATTEGSSAARLLRPAQRSSLAAAAGRAVRYIAADARARSRAAGTGRSARVVRRIARRHPSRDRLRRRRTSHCAGQSKSAQRLYRQRRFRQRDRQGARRHRCRSACQYPAAFRRRQRVDRMAAA